MKSNCDLSNGDQWSMVQKATLACGAGSGGNNYVINRYALNVSGISNPYSMNISLSMNKDSITGCSDSLKFSGRLQKIGTAAVSASDTLRIFVPSEALLDTIRCQGAACPSAAPAFTVVKTLSGTEYKWQIPGTLNNGDTLRLSAWLKSKTRRSGCTEDNLLRFRTTQAVSLYCSSSGAYCSGSQLILGQSDRFYDVLKPDLALSNYTGAYLSGNPQFLYTYAGRITNNATRVSVPSGYPTVLETWFDVNYDGRLEPGLDSLVRTKTYYNAINRRGGILNFADTFQYAGGLPPDPSRAMFTSIRTTGLNNCTCDSMVISSPVIGLPLTWGAITAARLKDQSVKLRWETLTEDNTLNFTILRMTDDGSDYRYLGRIHASGSSQVPRSYQFLDNSAEIRSHAASYRLVLTNTDGSTDTSAPVFVPYLQAPASQGFEVNPNPARHELYISGLATRQEAQYQIFSTGGMLLATGRLNEAHNKILITHLPNGIYVIRLTDKYRSGSLLFVKQ